MTGSSSAVGSEQLNPYFQDLEEAFRKGIIPSRESFRVMLGLDLILKVCVDYTQSIQETFPLLMDDFEIEGINDPPTFWAAFLPMGNDFGIRRVNVTISDPHTPTNVSEFESTLRGRGVRYATLGEGLSLIYQNPTVTNWPPFVTVHEFGAGERAAVFIGSLSGGERRVIRFKKIDFELRGCRHLIVTP